MSAMFIAGWDMNSEILFPQANLRQGILVGGGGGV